MLFFQVAIFRETLGYRMDDLGITSAAGTRDLSHFLKRSNWVRRPPTRPIQCVLMVLVFRVKRPWLETEHLPPASAEV